MEVLERGIELDMAWALRQPRVAIGALERLAVALGVLPKRKARTKADQWRADVMLACMTRIETEAREKLDYRYPLLREGSRGAAVERFQRLLRVAPTGRLSHRDCLEVEACQDAFGQKRTGVVDIELWRALEAKGYNPNIVPGPWFRCRKCDKALPDKRSQCNDC